MAAQAWVYLGDRERAKERMGVAQLEPRWAEWL
jgi:hypothetical protein